VLQVMVNKDFHMQVWACLKASNNCLLFIAHFAEKSEMLFTL